MPRVQKAVFMPKPPSPDNLPPDSFTFYKEDIIIAREPKLAWRIRIPSVGGYSHIKFSKAYFVGCGSKNINKYFCNKISQSVADQIGPDGNLDWQTMVDLTDITNFLLGAIYTNPVAPVGFLSRADNSTVSLYNYGGYLESSDDTTDGFDGTWEDEGDIGFMTNNNASQYPNGLGFFPPKTVKGIGIVITNTNGVPRRYLVGNQDAINNLQYDRVGKHVTVFADETERDNYSGNTDILAVVKTVSNGTSPSLQLYDHVNDSWEVL